MGFEDLHVAAPAARALAAMGWDTDNAMARDMAPTAARGHNLVAVIPPSPAYAAPALAGLLGRAGNGAQVLLLVPAAELDVWGALVNRLARELPLQVQTAHGEARALRRLRAGTLDVLLASPDTALSLLRRSALKPESLGAVLIAWPERLDDGEALAEVMHDLSKDAQRIVITAHPERAADLVERYARKALTVSAPGAASATGSGSVRTASVAWERRVQALAEIVELLDPAALAIWAADRSYEAEIARALPLGEDAVHFVTGEAPAAELIVAFDLPDAARLAQLRAAGSVVLLVPPGTERYVSSIAGSSSPLRLPGVVDAVTREAGVRRAAIAERLAKGAPERALLTLAPLFERHDPSAVAAALFELWSASGSAAPAEGAAAAPASSAASATGKIWVGIGKSDGATAADFVGTMTKELRIDRAHIGRIELKDSFSLIEVPAAEVERIAGALNGITIRRKRLVARADRGQTRDRPGNRDRSAPRDRSGPRKPPAGGRPPRRPA